VVQDSDSKILVLASADEQAPSGKRRHVTAVARFLENGMPDQLVAMIDSAQLSSPVALKVQGDGAIVVAGSAFKDGRRVFALARFLKDGSLDKGFGGLGTGVATSDKLFAGNASASGIDIDLMGNIVVAGTVDVGGWSDFALARFDKQGVVDQSFGDGGKITTRFVGPATLGAVAIQKNGIGKGRIVAAGTVWLNEKVGFVGLYSSEWVLVSYDPINGKPGPAARRSDGWRETRLEGGIIYTFFNMFDEAHAIAIQPNDGMIVVAGSTKASATGKSAFAVARYDLDNGDAAHLWLDTRFGGVGKFRIRFPGNADATANAVAILPDTRIVAAGSAIFTDDSSTKSAFAVSLMNANGSASRGFRDPTFGTSGVSMVAPGAPGPFEATGVAVQLDSKTKTIPKIVTVGDGPCHPFVCGGSQHAWVARYITNP
jgi:uncharacterized delta-60 repeat protein